MCGLSVTLFGTQKSRDYINCPTGTRSEASEGPTSRFIKTGKEATAATAGSNAAYSEYLTLMHECFYDYINDQINDMSRPPAAGIAIMCMCDHIVRKMSGMKENRNHKCETILPKHRHHE